MESSNGHQPPLSAAAGAIPKAAETRIAGAAPMRFSDRDQSSRMTRRSPTGIVASGKASVPAATHHSMRS
jgi:hypothetical protein